MSLFKQLLLAICLFLLAAFTGSFVVSLESSRGQYANQLRSHAQDAATALGLSLTANIDDPAMVELVVSSLFDSGYYQSIRVVGLDDEQPMIERQAEPDAGSAPQWFVRLIDLQPEGGEAIVSRGWQQVARVEVVSHPMFAVSRLWQSTLGMFGWLLLCGLVSALLGALLLRRQLRPLDDMVEQSQAITRREFLSVPQLPATPELRRVVLAMNLMVEKLKALFDEEARRSERLRDEAYHDGLTGLSNRRHFDMQLQARLCGEDLAGSGYMFLLRINDLAGLNQRLGGARTDELLRAVAAQLRQVTGDRHLIGRTRGGEFALLAVGLDALEAERLAEQLAHGLATLQQTGLSDRLPVAHIGLTPFSQDHTEVALYAALDQALAQADEEFVVGQLALAGAGRGLAVLRIDEDQVDVRGNIELAATLLAHGQHHHALGTAGFLAHRNAVGGLQLGAQERRMGLDGEVGEGGHGRHHLVQVGAPVQVALDDGRHEQVTHPAHGALRRQAGGQLMVQQRAEVGLGQR